MTSSAELEISMFVSLAQVIDNKCENLNGGNTSFDYVDQKARRGGGLSSWVIYLVEGTLA